MNIVEFIFRNKIELYVEREKESLAVNFIIMVKYSNKKLKQIFFCLQE